MLSVFFYMCERPENLNLSEIDWNTHRRIKTQVPIHRKETGEKILEDIYIVYLVSRLQEESLDDILSSVTHAVAPRMQAYDDMMCHFRRFQEMHEERMEFEMTPDERAAVMDLAIDDPTAIECLGYDYDRVLERAVERYSDEDETETEDCGF